MGEGREGEWRKLRGDSRTTVAYRWLWHCVLTLAEMATEEVVAVVCGGSEVTRRVGGEEEPSALRRTFGAPSRGPSGNTSGARLVPF